MGGSNIFLPKFENHIAAVALGYFAYNFIKIRRTLRWKARYESAWQLRTLPKLLSASCLDWAVLKGGYVSLRQLLGMPAVMKSAVAGQSVLYDDFAFGALLAPDLPQLLAPARARTFLIDPIDPQRAPAAQSDRVRVSTTEEFLSAEW